MPGLKRWLKPRWTLFSSQLTESDENGHGSCVISKVAGPRFGVAKNANIVVAKYAVDIQTGHIWKSSILELLSLIYEDVIARGLQGKAVVNLSFGGTEKAYGTQYIKSLRNLISRLLKSDVVVVVAAGNNWVSCLFV